jgi:hypothetical protein
MSAPALTRDLGIARPTRPCVIDNAEYAWNNAPKASEAMLSGGLPDDFIYDFRELLSGVAVAALEPLLRIEWAKRGYDVQFVPRNVIGSSEVERLVPDETYWAVWDAAVSQLEATELVAAAELNDELFGYREAAV